MQGQQAVLWSLVNQRRKFQFHRWNYDGLCRGTLVYEVSECVSEW